MMVEPVWGNIVPISAQNNDSGNDKNKGTKTTATNERNGPAPATASSSPYGPAQIRKYVIRVIYSTPRDFSFGSS